MSENETVLRLAKPEKKGLLSLVFSRLFLIAVLLALQVLLFVSLYGWFKEYVPHFAAFQIVFTALMLLYLFNNDMDSSAKLTWLGIIALFPIPGVIFFAYTQTNIGHRAVKGRVESLIAPGYVMPYCDEPLDNDKVGESVYIDMLYRANRYVHIMTPYLILDGELEAALAQCRAVTPETVKAEKLSYKLMGGLMKPVAPLM